MDVIICHPSRRESLIKNFSATRATEIANPANCFRRLVQLSNYETCYSVIHHLRNRSSVVSDDRCTTRHRFNHDQPERLWPINRKQQCVGISQKAVLLLIADFATHSTWESFSSGSTTRLKYRLSARSTLAA